MISIPVSPYCELARWVLDARGIPYIEECHAPVFHLIATRKCGGTTTVPVLDTGEVALLDARAVVDYYEGRSRQDQKLYPSVSSDEAEPRRLFNFFFDSLGVSICAWAYAQMLEVRASTARAWAFKGPWWERVGVYAFYPFLATEVRRSLGLKSDTVAREAAAIDAALSQIEARLADGRRYLMGDSFTAADLALAALSAPIVIPPQYGGPLPSINELPAQMKKSIE